MQPVLYVDLDGVLVNLKKKIGEIYNSNINSLSSNEFAILFYDLIGEMNYQQTINFWESLEETSDCHLLWDFLKNYQPLILTSVSGNKASVIGKKNWCKNNLKIEPERVFCSRKSSEKQNFACPQAILIDDLDKNIEGFRSKGGYGILHVNAKQTITELQELFKNNSFLFGS
jgi:hypothetical protein